ncbi:MAG: hypothetical protein SGPRY_008411, partial [Prymnesium sp.]
MSASPPRTPRAPAPPPPPVLAVPPYSPAPPPEYAIRCKDNPLYEENGLACDDWRDEAGKCIAEKISSDPTTATAIGICTAALLFTAAFLQRKLRVKYFARPKLGGWLTYFFAILGPTVLFLAATGAYAGCYLSVTLWSAFALLHIFVTFLFANAACAEPGFISCGAKADFQTHPNKHCSFMWHVNGTDVKLKYCDTCHVVRPARASHDRHTDRCVRRFDHYCPFLGNAVGEGNYLWFLLFVVTTFTSSALFNATCIWHMFHLSSRLATTSDAESG